MLSISVRILTYTCDGSPERLDLRAPEEAKVRLECIKAFLPPTEEMIRIMISKSVIKYEHDGVEEDDDKNGCN